MNPNTTGGLSEHELAALDRLEDKLGRGASVHWDEPKTIRGVGARPIETATVKDYNDPSKMISKRVATLRTANGLEAIWEGPAGLEKLFEADITGHPVIVTYKGERVSQESGRPYKAFDVIVGDAAGAGTASHDADSDIAFRPEAW